MKRLAAAVLLVSAVLPRAASAAGPAPIAVELSRIALPEANWNASLKQSSEQVRQVIEQQLTQSGATLTPDFSARLAEEFRRMMPSYQEVVDLQAGLLVKHYTEAELRELLAFYRTPLGQKSIRIMPEVTADVNAYMMSLMQQRMPAMFERLKPMLEQSKPGAPSGGSGAPTPPGAVMNAAQKKPGAK